MHTRKPDAQSGFLIIEALIAILIFSIGILALVSFYASSIRDTSAARYRTEASFLANQLFADMWTNRANLATYQFPGSGTPPTSVKPWTDAVGARLPGTTGKQPKIEVDTSNNVVTVTIYWKAPGQDDFNQLQSVTQIGMN